MPYWNMKNEKQIGKIKERVTVAFSNFVLLKSIYFVLHELTYTIEYNIFNLKVFCKVLERKTESRFYSRGI